ncbi:MAG: HAD family hydrolase [Clostridia bacterium]|nr:HAD family hydrolase [Clostridia bacterium]
MSYKYVLFDLDGTLTDPFEGITNSVAYSLNYYGIRVEDKRELACFIGPPLYESFEKYYGFSKNTAIEAVEKYREYYRDKGIFENRVYDGAEDLLKFLKENGLGVALATSKPEVFALRILEHFGLEKYFDVVTGATLDGSLIKKGDVVAEALKRLNVKEKRECVMVGDRSHDIIGAKENGISSVGVLFGYGSKAELKEAGADYICESLEEIKNLLF